MTDQALDNAILKEVASGNRPAAPTRSRADVQHRLRVSERRACRVLGQWRATPRHQALVRDDEPRLVTRLIALASDYGRYEYRRVTALFHREG